MSSHAERARERTRGRKSSARPPDEPGEVPADLKAVGWELLENVSDPDHPDRPFKMVNRKMKWETSPYATAQLAVNAARTIQKLSKQKGAAVTEPEPDERFGVGAKAPAVKYARTRSFPMELGVALSAEQIDAKIDELKEAAEELDELERRSDQVKKTFKADIEAAEARKREVERVLIRRADDSEVQVEERIYDDARVVAVVRLDTGVIVEQRAMKPEEAQRSLLTSI
jgi:hypothetical protein